jgi:hypothetical protein
LEAQSVPFVHLTYLVPPLAQVSWREADVTAIPGMYWSTNHFLPSRFEYLELVDYTAPDFGYSALRAQARARYEKPPDDEPKPRKQ